MSNCEGRGGTGGGEGEGGTVFDDRLALKIIYVSGGVQFEGGKSVFSFFIGSLAWSSRSRTLYSRMSGGGGGLQKHDTVFGDGSICPIFVFLLTPGGAK